MRAGVPGRLLVALAVLAAGCGKKAPPSGGPPDVEPPRRVASQPDSGAAGVARDATLSLTFSEGMEPRATGDAIAFAPPVEIRRLRWSGRTVTVVPAESLRARQTYTLFVGRGARDRHGNTMESGATVVFTTADSFPPGALEGRIEAQGFSAGGSYLWCYDAARHHEPDSTGRDFDAVGLVDVDGRFRVPALPIPAEYRLWTFADLDGNRSFEPDRDILARVDTVIALSAGRPVVRDLVFRVINPRAPARVKGTVIDSLAEREGQVWVMAVADTDSTRRVLTGVNDQLQWELGLDPGAWTIRAFKDLDGNHFWNRGHEPTSDPQALRAEPAGRIEGLVLELKPVARAP